MHVQRRPVTGGKFTLPIDASGRWFVRFYTKNASDEGHGFHNEENRFDFYRQMETFFSKY